MTEKSFIAMWVSVGVAVIFATWITGNPFCLYGFAAPTAITFFSFLA